MARNPDDMAEDNLEQRDEGQAQDVAEDALERGRDATSETEHGAPANPASVIPEDVPDLVDTMNQMVTSGLIDNGAYAGEPMMDDEEDVLGITDDDVDSEDRGLRLEE